MNCGPSLSRPVALIVEVLSPTDTNETVFCAGPELLHLSVRSFWISMEVGPSVWLWLGSCGSLLFRESFMFNHELAISMGQRDDSCPNIAAPEFPRRPGALTRPNAFFATHSWILSQLHGPVFTPSNRGHASRDELTGATVCQQQSIAVGFVGNHVRYTTFEELISRQLNSLCL